MAPNKQSTLTVVQGLPVSHTPSTVSTQEGVAEDDPPEQ